MSQAVLDAIHTKLTTDQSAGSFYDDLDGRIYHVQGVQDAALPLCVFQMTGRAPLRYLEEDGVGDEFDIFLYGDEATGQRALGLVNDKLIALLDKASVTITGFVGGQAWNLDRGVSTKDEDAIVIVSRWRIWASES